MDTRDKLIGIAIILAGVALMVLGIGLASRSINNIPETHTPLNPYVDAYSEYGYIEIID